MKAIWLKLGDYVKRNGQPEKVFELANKQINGLPESEFKPLGITPEMLVKNGFKAAYETRYTLLGTYSKVSVGFHHYPTDQHLVADSVEVTMYDTDFDEKITIENNCLEYMHDLQQAMTYCGLKDIEL